MKNINEIIKNRCRAIRSVIDSSVNIQLKIEVPETVKTIIHSLKENGYQAYIVGGCVRDALLGIQPKDWDITTNATPQETKTIMQKHNIPTYDTGIQYGTIVAVLNGENYEITTFRKDSTYSDGRRPDSVTFSSSIEEDLKRRDLTINAIAYDIDTNKLIDPYGGTQDIINRKIRTVGSAEERFLEDALRIMRAIRFGTRLEFDIDSEIIETIKNNIDTISHVSMERIRDEFEKILMTNKPSSGIWLMKEVGLLKVLLPEVDELDDVEQNNPNHIYDVFNHTMVALDASEKDIVIRWTILLHDTGKKSTRFEKDGIDRFYNHDAVSAKIAENVLKRFKVDNKTTKEVTILIEYHDNRPEKAKSVRKLISKINSSGLDGYEMFEKLLKVNKADNAGQNPAMWEKKEIALNQTRELFKTIKENQEPISMQDLAINGRDLIRELKVTPGPILGEILKRLLEKVLENPDINNRETLLSKAQDIYRSIK